MSRFWYPVRKFVTNLFRRPLAAASTLLSLFLLLMLFDLVWVSALTGLAWQRHLISDVEMEIFIGDSLPDSSVTIIRSTVINLDGVRGIDFISRETARMKLLDLMGADLLEGFEDNPLPRSVIITFWDNYLTSERLQEFADQISRLNGVTDVYYPRKWLEDIEATQLLVTRVVIFLGIVIFIAVTLNIIHAIRLSVRVRESEIKQLRLLGAGRIFLSAPYVLEGIFYTLTASSVGWLSLYYFSGQVSFQQFDLILPVWLDMIYFCLITAIVGMVSGYIGARRAL
jgi:cell division transport system permease protein